jgi:hypothetical protein
VVIHSSSCCWLLDESKMTPEVRKFVEKHGSDTSLTKREWESYVPHALREFDIQERGVGRGIPEEKSDDGEDNESQDDLSLGNIPSLMPWDDPYEAPEPGLDSKLITGRLRVAAPPLPFVIIVGGWPSALIALLALNLPVQSAYFPARLHKYIKPSKCEVMLWKTPSTFSYDNVSGEVIFVVSGTSAFIRGVLSSLPSEGVHRTIASVEFPLRGTSRNVVKSLRFQGRAVLVDFGLRPVDFWDRNCGGATDAIHTVGFGTRLHLGVLPVPEPGLALCLRHFIDGGTALDFPRTVLQMPVPTLNSFTQVQWHDNILLSGGLFPCQHPRALVYCPCYRLPPEKLVIRALPSHEMLRLYQLPRSMDALLAVLHPNSPLPYEDLAPPGLFTSVLRQLWGVVRGGSALEGDRRVDKEKEEEVVEEEERRVSLDPSAKPWCPVSTTATNVTPAQRMTAATLDIQLVDDDEDV